MCVEYHSMSEFCHYYKQYDKKLDKDCGLKIIDLLRDTHTIKFKILTKNMTAYEKSSKILD